MAAFPPGSCLCPILGPVYIVVTAALVRVNRQVVCDSGPVTLCGAPSADGNSATMWVLDQAGAPCLYGDVTFAATA